MDEELNQIIDEMLQVKDAIAAHEFDLKQLKQKEELIAIKLEHILNQTGADEMVLPTCYFGYKTTSRCAFNQKLFSAENPDLYEKYKTTSESTKFEFKIGAKK